MMDPPKENAGAPAGHVHKKPKSKSRTKSKRKRDNNSDGQQGTTQNPNYNAVPPPGSLGSGPGLAGQRPQFLRQEPFPNFRHRYPAAAVGGIGSGGGQSQQRHQYQFYQSGPSQSQIQNQGQGLLPQPPQYQHQHGGIFRASAFPPLGQQPQQPQPAPNQNHHPPRHILPSPFNIPPFPRNPAPASASGPVSSPRGQMPSPRGQVQVQVHTQSKGHITLLSRSDKERNQNQVNNGNNPSKIQSNHARMFYTLLNEPRKDRSEFKVYCDRSLQEQLDIMMNVLSLSEDDKNRRKSIIESLHQILQREFPFISIYAFGSYLTGLGDCTSDLDLYVDAYGLSEGHKGPKNGGTLKDVFERCLKTIRRAKDPQSFRAFCTLVVPIREARVPILKVSHWRGVNMDLSFENLTSVRNSELIRLYTEMDPCVKPLLMFIRYWARFHDLTGSTAIKNYCLVLMVLVFLTFKNILPSVDAMQKLRHEELLSKKKSKNVDLIEEWDTGFIRDLDVIRIRLSPTPSLSLSTKANERTLTHRVFELAKQFFEYFGSLDFSDNMICTLTAEVLPKQLFLPGNEEGLPNTLDKYKEWACRQPANRRLNSKAILCVQDPFVLSFNVGNTASMYVVLKFQKACRETALLLSDRVDSILQLLQPFSFEAGDKKYLSLWRKHKATVRVKEEIKNVMNDSHQQGQEDEQQEQDCASESEEHADHKAEEYKFLFKSSLNEVADREEVLYGKGCESAMKYQISQDFQRLFTDGLHNVKLPPGVSTDDMYKKMKSLWVTFFLKYVDALLQSFGVDFTVERSSKPASRPLDFVRQTRARKQFDDICCSTFSTNPVLPNVAAHQSAVLSELDAVPEEEEAQWIYLRYNCSASQDVWGQRHLTRNEMLENILVQKAGKAALAATKKNKTYKTVVKLFQEFDPLGFENEVTERILQFPKPVVKSRGSKFTVYVKICNGSKYELFPYAEVAFESIKDSRRSIFSCVNTVVETFQETLDPYFMFSLKQWLHFFDQTGPLSPSSPSGPTDASFMDPAEDIDLLLPPSESSSTCSSPMPQEDQEETNLISLDDTNDLSEST